MAGYVQGGAQGSFLVKARAVSVGHCPAVLIPFFSSLAPSSVSCYILSMSVTQTVEIPASHRLIIDVPREVPAGRAVLTFTPAVADQRSDQAEECPFCVAHRDPVTGNPRYKPEVYEGMQKVEDMLSGKIPSTLHRHNSLDEMLADLDSDD